MDTKATAPPLLLSGTSVIHLRRLEVDTPAVVRHQVVGLLEQWCRLLPCGPSSDALVDSVGLVVTELVTNVLRHAPGPCAVAVELRDGLFHLRVRDEHPPNAPMAWPQVPCTTPDVDRPSGRGLWIAAHRSTGFHFEAPADGPGKVACASWKVA